jgi:hypothetical protein
LREGRDYREAEAFVKDRDGREVPVGFTLFPLRDRDRVVGGVVILRTRDRDPGGTSSAVASAATESLRKLLGAGRSPGEIAKELGISPESVRGHGSPERETRRET